jgi:acetoin utilization deacetylase AcuC-like enzyme
LSLPTAKANLVDALKKLRHSWERAKQDWDDDASKLFFKEFIEPLESRVTSAIKGVDHVVELVSKVRRDCGDDG